MFQHFQGLLAKCITFVYLLDTESNVKQQIYKMQETKSEPFMIRMRPSVKKAGEKAAADDNRSLASLMEHLLVIYLQDHGFLPKKK